MEARVSGGAHQSFDLGASIEMNGLGKRSAEWDLNDWRWDGDLFVATPLNAVPADCRSKQLFPLAAIGDLSNSSSSCSGEADPGINGKEKGESGKRRREMVVVDEDEVEPDDEANPLTLKLGGRVYPVSEQADLANGDGKNGKRSKVQVGNSNRAVCQVEGCGADLSDAKEYHRRHKVCETHAKASKAIVGNVMQRFCQQCSRFHLLQEFDEGKRSCRRRLAGHNRRRRKTHPDAVANGASLTDDHASSYLLISLLRILANLNSDSSGQPKDQDLLSHLLKNLALLAGSFDLRNLHGLLQTSQDLQKNGTAAATSSEAAQVGASNGAFAQESSMPVCSSAKTNRITEYEGCSMRPTNQSVSHVVASVEMQKRNITEISVGESLHAVPCGRPASLGSGQDCTLAKDDVSSLKVLPRVSPVERVKFRSFDLNDVCNDGHDSTEEPKDLASPARLQTGSLHCPPWLLQDSRQASPPQTSGNSNSASAQSLTSSDGDAQSRTDRMVFKLFGKDPNDLPLVLRTQILDWLSSSPTDIEGYIRPGCIILTIYLRLTESKWEQLCHDLRASLERLLEAAADDFWTTGWVYARIQHQIAFIYDGRVMLDTPLPPSSHNCRILSVTPIAVSASEKVNFTVRGLNLAQSSIRLLCAFEGKYLVEETTHALVDSSAASNEYDGVECLSFSCSIPNATGRGFIEVEDYGLGSSFYPFIVAEEDVSSEICMLESTINGFPSDGNYHGMAAGMKQRAQALDFVHEMGWLLRRSNLRFSSGNRNFNVSIFPLTRFRWLMEFSMDNEWCAVVKKLLDVLFGGAVELGGHRVEVSLSDMSLLHNAVQKKQRRMVEFLLRYVPADDLEDSSQNTQEKSCHTGFFFRPDMLGPFDVTPLHIAASIGDAEGVLDALTNDPGQVGIKAWKTARDASGLTPEAYALARGYNSYINLVEKKNNQELGAEHVVVDIPGISADLDVNQKQSSGPNSRRSTGFLIKKTARPPLQVSCRLCTPRQTPYGVGNVNLAYRPMMLFMVGIAAVCVCVGILLHSPPEVFSVFPPFRWELLDYGFM